MGFVKVTDATTGAVISDSRRDDLSAKSNKYIETLSRALDQPGLEVARAELIESATAREYAERVETTLENEIGIETRQEKKRAW